MAQTNPLAGLPPAPTVSKRTVPIAGISVDFYGIDELPAGTTSVAVLWLHHPRTRARADMADIAARTVDAVRQSARAADARRGLIGAALDQRNHGERHVSEAANSAWTHGNSRHAQDMFGLIAGTATDTRLLIDLLGAYSDALFGPRQPAPTIAQHLVLGVSLGGHSAWQLLFADERVTAAVSVIGSPDYIALLEDRARLSKLPSYAAAQTDGGAPFVGSPDFPPALVSTVCRYDPRGLLFGTAAPAWPATSEGEAALRDALKRHVGGKRLLLTSGGADKLVPYAVSVPFLETLKRAAADWPALQLSVEDNVYEGIGHAFSTAMIADAVRFVVETVEADVAGHSSSGSKTAKI